MWIPSPSADQNHLAERKHKYSEAVIKHTQDVFCSFTADTKSLHLLVKMAGFTEVKKTKINHVRLVSNLNVKLQHIEIKGKNI